MARDKEWLHKLAETVWEYYPRIYRYFAYRVKNGEEAEDMTSQTILQAVQGLGDLKGEMQPWIFRIARNLWVDRLRRKKIVQEEPLDEHSLLVDPKANSADQILDVETLQSGLRHLSDEEQEVVLLRFVDDLPVAQVSQHIGKSEGAVRVIQYRALQKLREVLEP